MGTERIGRIGRQFEYVQVALETTRRIGQRRRVGERELLTRPTASETLRVLRGHEAIALQHRINRIGRAPHVFCRGFLGDIRMEVHERATAGGQNRAASVTTKSRRIRNEIRMPSTSRSAPIYPSSSATRPRHKIRNQ
jgi:hypothetical protein